MQFWILQVLFDSILTRFYGEHAISSPTNCEIQWFRFFIFGGSKRYSFANSAKPQISTQLQRKKQRNSEYREWRGERWKKTQRINLSSLNRSYEEMLKKSAASHHHNYEPHFNCVQNLLEHGNFSSVNDKTLRKTIIASLLSWLFFPSYCWWCSFELPLLAWLQFISIARFKTFLNVKLSHFETVVYSVFI